MKNSSTKCTPKHPKDTFKRHNKLQGQLRTKKSKNLNANLTVPIVLNLSLVLILKKKKQAHKVKFKKKQLIDNMTKTSKDNHLLSSRKCQKKSLKKNDDALLFKKRKMHLEPPSKIL